MSAPSAAHQSLRITVGGVELEADLGMPDNPRGAVLFAHGSGSGRRSPRNRYVAAEVNRAGLVTVLADLLTPREEQVDLATAALRFDIDLLAARVTALTDWIAQSEPTAGLGIGLFGASTGAAAALVAAARQRVRITAIVSRGGRPDLAGDALSLVNAPTLLIVGGRDGEVIELNERAIRRMHCERRLEVVPGATHLFEEPGTLERASELAVGWFARHLGSAHRDLSAS